MSDIKEKYTCDACRYTFESDKLPDRCPDCGKFQVRRAIRYIVNLLSCPKEQKTELLKAVIENK